MFATCDHRLQLTQQQRNNKRQRASSHQLRVLHQCFRTNPKPNSWARQQIGRQIDMTPRSVQIWFQNKRAKLKKAFGGYCGQTTSQHSRAQVLNCTSLIVGDWVRVLNSASPDLWVSVNASTGTISYTISHRDLYYRAGVPSEAIESVELMEQSAGANAGADMSGCLQILVKNAALITFQVSNDAKTWAGCTDFTGGQIFSADQHNIYGRYNELLIQAAELIFRYF